MLKSGDLSYIVGSMQFSGYLRQARYDMTATHSGSKLWRSWLAFLSGLTMFISSNLFKEQIYNSKIKCLA